MGMRVMTATNNGAAARNIRRILIHPQYDQFTSDYDIALLELSSAIFFNDLVQPVCVPAASHSFTTGTSCYVTGWGVVMEDGETCLLHQIKSSQPTAIPTDRLCLWCLQVNWPLVYKRLQ